MKPFTPLIPAIDQLLAIETPNMAWLRRNASIARRLNQEAALDPKEDAR